MKKIVMGLAAVAMATSMFAADPAFAPSLAEYSGNQSVTWGIDLDNDNKTGFKNDGSATLKFNLFTAGDKTTSGDSDIWAELKIKNDAKDTTGAMVLPGASVDTAKFHIYNMYVGIKSGDTQTGALKFTRAIKSGDNDNGKLLSDVGPDKYTQGIVAGYDDSNYGVAVDFRSKLNGTDQYTNDYALAAEATLKDSNEFLSGLEVKGGYSYEFADKPLMGYSGSVAYKATISGDYYVKPAFGYTGTSKDGTTTNMIAGALMFGWGDTADANAGVYFLDDDAAKKVTPGVSVSYVKNLEVESDLGAMEIAFFSGSIVENLKAAALAEMKLVKDVDTVYTVKAGAKYDIKADKVTITPQAGFVMTSKTYVEGTPAGEPTFVIKPADPDTIINDAHVFWEKKDGAAAVPGKFVDATLKVKVGVDVAGLINNTVFSCVWESGDLKADPAGKGKVNLTAKISL